MSESEKEQGGEDEELKGEEATTFRGAAAKLDFLARLNLLMHWCRIS